MEMMMNICLILACLAAAGGLAVLLAGWKKDGLPVLPWLFAAMGTGLVLLLLPVYIRETAGESWAPLRALVLSVHHAVRIFVLDEDSTVIREFAREQGGAFSQWYSLLAVVLSIAAPAMTLGFVLSFFRGTASRWALLRGCRQEAFVFTAPDAASLTLAGSLRENHPRALLVFADCGEARLPRHLRAVEVSGSASELHLPRMGGAKATFFAMTEDEDRNIRDALALKAAFGGMENTALYVFARGAESEMLFREGKDCAMHIRRLHPGRAFVYELLSREGIRLFESARPGENGIREIHAVLLGLGRNGSELLRALAWLCQMDGYYLRLHVFDKAADAEDRFRAQCPELLDSRYNGVFREGDAAYEICIHSGVDVTSWPFETIMEALPPMTWGFVSLGSDETNVRAAMRLREICQRRECHPVLYAVMEDSERADLLRGITDYRGTLYEICFVGGTRDICTEQVLLNSSLEREALERHLRWGQEDDFWGYEFCCRSSMASALHRQMRVHCGIPGAEKPVEERTIREREQLARLEHRRWNAYMRTEGYRYSGSADPASRNDLARLHNCLVPYEELPEIEKRKDDI